MPFLCQINLLVLFTFLKYIQPAHYFSLRRKDGSFIFPKYDALPPEIIKQLDWDENYQSTISAQFDISYQAVKRGHIGDEETYGLVQELPIADEYRFIKKYFHPVWAHYVLLLRLLSFKNPFKEFSGWRKARAVKKVAYMDYSLEHKDWANFNSRLVADRPLVSIVIPTLNRYPYMVDILKDFEKQTYTNFEVVVVDQSQPYQKEFYEEYKLTINLVQQEEPALWLARNTAVKLAKGAIIMLSEDDVRIEPDWIENHLKCLDFFNAKISAGVFFPEGSSIPKDRSFFATAAQFATGNAALYKDVFKEIGLFDRQFERQRMGDGEFGMRAFMHGVKSVSTPYACCIDVKAPSGGLRQMGSWDAFRPKKWFAPRPIPSVLYLFRRYFGTKRTYLTLLKTIPPSIIPYKFKKNRKMMLLGIFVSMFLLPIICIQVIISWNKASNKINEGPLISELD